MDIPMIEMEPAAAQARLAHYAKADPAKLTPDDKALIVGYKALAQRSPVIDVVAAIRAAGLNGEGLPKLAMARADLGFVEWYTGWRNDGGGSFATCQRAVDDRRFKGQRFEVPPGTFAPYARGVVVPNRRRAFLPPVPIQHRPADPSRYHLLWEAEWRPVAPVDPYLLRHLTGTLYVVVAQWDLTDLERAVMGARIAVGG